MTILGLLLFGGVIVLGITMGLSRRREIESLRQPKTHWRQGHKLRYATPAEIAAAEKAARKPRPRTYGGVPLDEADLEEMDGMFGDAGTHRRDY